MAFGKIFQSSAPATLMDLEANVRLCVFGIANLKRILLERIDLPECGARVNLLAR